MKRADSTSKRAAALIERAGKALANGSCDSELIAAMAQLLSEISANQADLRRAQEQSARTIADLHTTLREVRRSHSRGLDPQMQRRIDTVAPENLEPLQRPVRLWAVHDLATDTYHPMRSQEAAELFTATSNAVAELENRPPQASVELSVWPEVDHWREVARQEAEWNSEAQQIAYSALQQVDSLNEQIEQLREGLDLPTRPLRAVAVYTDNCDGGRFVTLGQATGAGKYEGVHVVAYRDASTGKLLFRSPHEFEECMTLEHKR